MLTQTKNNDFYDRLTVSLKREYSKDEVVSFFIKKLSDKEIEVGKLKAEIDHLEYELEKHNKEINKAAKIEVRKDELYKLKCEERKKQSDIIKKLRRDNNDLITKCLLLKNPLKQ